MTKRILVTGSRNWTDRETIDAALRRAYIELSDDGSEVVLVHGDCHLGGADIIARDIWHSHGLTDEPHPAEMGPNGHVLGPERNKRMVDLGADVCLAFPLSDSRGTLNCMRYAHQAGIPVRTYTPRNASQASRVIRDQPMGTVDRSQDMEWINDANRALVQADEARMYGRALGLIDGDVEVCIEKERRRSRETGAPFDYGRVRRNMHAMADAR